MKLATNATQAGQRQQHRGLREGTVRSTARPMISPVRNAAESRDDAPRTVPRAVAMNVADGAIEREGVPTRRVNGTTGAGLDTSGEYSSRRRVADRRSHRNCRRSVVVERLGSRDAGHHQERRRSRARRVADDDDEAIIDSLSRRNRPIASRVGDWPATLLGSAAVTPWVGAVHSGSKPETDMAPLSCRVCWTLVGSRITDAGGGGRWRLM